MRIQRLRIHNYRSIRDLEMECLPLVTLLGPNNHGKSNLLAALEFCLSTSAKPVEQDFFVKRGEGDNDLWVEITFNELTEQEKNTFKKYVQSDGTVCIRKTARIQNGGIEVFYNGYVEQPDVEWLNSDKAGDYTSRESVNQTPLKDFVPSSGRLTKAHIEEAQQKYIEQHRKELKFSRVLEEGPLLGQKNVGGGVLPDFYLIPAVRDLTDEIKLKTTTTFGRLLNRAVREMAETDPRFRKARKQLEEVVQSLNVRDHKEQENNRLADLERSIEEALQPWGVKVNIEVTPPELEQLFELGTYVHLNDGVKTTADRKGHGLQRAMIFALLRAWAKTLREGRNSRDQGGLAPRKQSDSVIFAMEEPELFLHPHAQRRLAMTLREIAATPEHQVFICTHSTHFVDLEHYKEVAIITKYSLEEGSCVRQCVKELFEGDDTDERKKRFHMAQWINPDRGEMFFAKRVVFVEGETEKVVLPFLAQKLGVLDPDISIIDCGSKHNLPLYIAIAKAFEIPYLVIHDEDPLPDPIPDEWNEDKRKARKRTFELNDHIKNLVEAPLGQVEMLSPDFETVSGVSKSQGEKKGKALAALDHFEAVDQSKIPDRLRQVVYAAFNAQGEIRMITNLNPYPAYKDSGAPWLGKVPVHWELRSLGSLISAISQRGQPDLPLLSVVREKGVIPRTSMSEDENHNFVPDDLSNYKVVRKGNLVINKMKAWQGSLGIAPMDGIVSPAYFVFDFRIGDQRFGQALLRSKTYVAFFAQESDGVRIGQWDLSIHGMKRIPVVVPPLPEQTAIVRFLDYMDRRIRRYIRAKQKLIKLLEEYRQALIHQAVTGQIDVRTGQPYPTYKPSGVEWLGDVPAHWEVVPLRWFISIASGDFIETSAVSGNRSNERPYPVIGGNGVMGYAGVYNSTEITVVVGRVGALCGNVHIVNEPAWITDNALMITLIRELSEKFLSIQLKVMDLNRLANANAQPLVTGGMIKAQRVVKPPIHEQLAIVDFVEEQTAKINAAIAAARREIDLLREYRTRLIADVVTGKVDVREVAAQLPEEPPEEEAESMDTDEIAEGEATDDDAAAEALSEEEVEP